MGKQQKWLMKVKLTCSISTVWNVGANAVCTTKSPLMKRTFNAITSHHSTNAEIGPQVWTIGIQDVRHSLLCAEDGKMLTQTVDTYRLAAFHVFRLADAEPSVRKWGRQFLANIPRPANSIYRGAPRRITRAFFGYVVVSDSS